MMLHRMIKHKLLMVEAPWLHHAIFLHSGWIMATHHSVLLFQQKWMHPLLNHFHNVIKEHVSLLLSNIENGWWTAVQVGMLISVKIHFAQNLSLPQVFKKNVKPLLVKFPFLVQFLFMICCVCIPALHTHIHMCIVRGSCWHTTVRPEGLHLFHLA
jgi:hypothetical protein